jgi:hypothetical protein
MPTKQQLEKIAEELSDPFLRGMDSFAPLDTRGLPRFNTTGPEPSFIDERFAPLDTRGMSIVNGLKKLVEDPDDEALAELATRSGDMEFVRQYREQKEDERQEQEAKKFVKQTPDYFQSPKNYQKLCRYLDEHELDFTADNLGLAFHALRSAGPLEFDPDKPQPLTTEQLIYVARLAARGDLENATLNYIHYALPNWDRDTDPTSDPRPEIQQVMSDCAWFVFINSTPEFKDGQDVRRFMMDHVGNRPTTVRLLQVAFKLWQQEEKWGTHARLLEESREPAVEEQNLDDLSDQEIATLLRGATREQLKRGS